MEYKAPTESYSGQIREVIIGTGGKTLKIGGENILAFHSFDEGSSPNPPKFALEVYDMEPTSWADWIQIANLDLGISSAFVFDTAFPLFSLSSFPTFFPDR